MKIRHIYVIGTIAGIVILAAGCATHPVRCRDALQPINRPVAAAHGPKAVAKEPHP